MADEFTKAALYWIKTFNRKVKETIWMQKLIELLNEYDKYRWEKRRVYWWTKYKVELDVNLIISKKYEFIKWLVDNDKIDFSLIPNKIKEIWIPMKINWEIKYWFDSSDYYWLLMLLSISDTPIEDLLLYLK